MIVANLYDRLREATAVSHQSFEHALRMPERVQSSESYGEILGRIYGVYAPIEERMRDFPDLAGLGYDISQRAKTPALQEDLNALHIDWHGIAWCPKLPTLDRVGQVFGCLYVMEAATLGGRMIGAMAKAAGVALPMNFFNVYGNHTRERWTEFQEALTEFESASRADNDVVHGAIETFEAFEAWCA